MSRAALAAWEASEPDRLEIAAKNWVRKGHAATTLTERARLWDWAAKARGAAATLRAMRSARLRLNYSQPR